MILVPRSTVFGSALPTSTNGGRRPLLEPGRPYLTIHYTGGGLWLDPDDTPTELRQIQAYAQGAGKPWEYNYVIDGQGLVFEYAGQYRAAHYADHSLTPPVGRNELAVGVLLLVGLADAATLSGFEKPTEPMIVAVRDLRAWLVAEGHLHPAHQMLQHRQMPGAATICPGPEVVKRWDALTLPVPPPTPKLPPVEDDMKPLFLACEGRPGQFFYVPGAGPPIAFTNIAERDKLLTAFGIDENEGVELAADMFDRLQ